MSNDVRDMLEGQVRKAEELASAMTRDRSEYIGAEKALRLIAGQMPAYVKSLDERIEGDKDLGGAAEHVRRYAHNIVAYIQAMCESSALKQRNEVLLCEGRAQTAQMMATTMKKELDNLERIAESDAVRIAKRSEVMFEEPRKEVEVESVEPPKSKGGRKHLRPVPEPPPKPQVDSEAERKAKAEAARKAKKAAARTANLKARNNGVQNT